MSRYYLYYMPFLWLALSLTAQCGVIERDWKVAGDGLLTYDNVNQREWLDLSESLLENFAGDMGQNDLQNALLELEQGGMFEDFTLANSEDVITLAESAVIDTETSDFDRNVIPTTNLIQLLSPTLINSADSFFTIGVLDLPLVFSSFFVTPQRGPSGAAGISIGRLDFGGPSQIGLMLYRPIPEPVAILFELQIISFFITTRHLLKRCSSDEHKYSV